VLTVCRVLLAAAQCLPCVRSGTYGKEFLERKNKKISKKIFAVSQIAAHGKDVILKKRKHS